MQNLILYKLNFYYIHVLPIQKGINTFKSTSQVSYLKEKREGAREGRKEGVPLTAVREKAWGTAEANAGQQRVPCRPQRATVGRWPHCVPALLASFPVRLHAALIPATGHLHELERSRADQDII